MKVHINEAPEETSGAVSGSAMNENLSLMCSQFSSRFCIPYLRLQHALRDRILDHSATHGYNSSTVISNLFTSLPASETGRLRLALRSLIIS